MNRKLTRHEIDEISAYGEFCQSQLSRRMGWEYVPVLKRDHRGRSLKLLACGKVDARRLYYKAIHSHDSRHRQIRSQERLARLFA